MEDINKLKKEFFEQLDERQKRLYAALTAIEQGHFGVSESERLFGLHANTIRRGKTDLLNLESDLVKLGKTRRPGGGRKKKA